MNILVVSQYFYPENFRINDVAAALAEQGHRVKVLTGLPDYASSKVPREYRFFRRRRESWNGVEIVRVPTLSRRRGMLCRALNYASFAVSGMLYARMCRFRADLVLSYQTSPVLQALPALSHKKRAGAPLLLYCCDLWPESLKAWGIGENHLLFRLMKGWSRRIYRGADRLAVTSAPFVEYLERELGLPRERMTYLPQHAEDWFSSVCCRFEDHDTVNCLFAGNIGAVQNVDCLLEAASQLPEDSRLRLQIVGDGSELPRLRRLSEEWGLQNRVTFYGARPAQDMPDFYRQADILVLTLRGGDFIGQTLPAKFQGYLGAGKPVAAAADGAVPLEMTAADCGICVPAGDAQGLAAALEKMAACPELYREKGRKGRRYFEEHFTLRQFMERLDELIRQLTEADEGTGKR